MGDLVSVILPVYNGAETVGAAVESILRQTVKDLELIVVDDGSSDDSASVACRAARGDKRCRILTKENGGVARATMFGVDAARGNLIARMDADDISLQTRIEATTNKLRAERLDVVGGWVRSFGHGIGRTWQYFPQHEQIAAYLLYSSPFANSTTVARREVYELARGFSGRTLDDYRLWTLAAENRYKFGNVESVQVLYRKSRGGLTASNLSRNVEIRREIAESYWRALGYAFPVAGIARVESVMEFLDSRDRLVRALERVCGKGAASSTSVVDTVRLRFCLENTHLGMCVLRDIIRSRAALQYVRYALAGGLMSAVKGGRETTVGRLMELLR